MSKVVFTSGLFSALHAGHCKLFEFASGYGEVVALLSRGESYGDSIPSIMDRAYCLKSNKYVSKVILYHEDDPRLLIEKYYPDYYIVPPHGTFLSHPELVACDKIGTEIIFTPDDNHYNDRWEDLLGDINYKPVTFG